MQRMRGRGELSRRSYAAWRTFTMRYGTPLMALWAAAEATFWPILPDAMLIAVLAGRPRRWVAPLAAAAIASALAGAALYLFAWAAPEAARNLLDWMPFLSTEQAAQAREAIERDGPVAFLYQPISGVPYKAYALVAGSSGISPLESIPASVLSRSLRMAVVALVASMVLRRSEALTARWFLPLVGGYIVAFAVAWLLLYLLQA